MKKVATRTETSRMSGIKKRIVFVGAALTAVLTILMLRIYQIQVVSGDEYSSLTRSQYMVELKGLETRGQILDRNGQPIAGEIDEYYYFIEKEQAERAKKLMRLIGAEDVTQASDIYKVYKTKTFDAEICKTLTQGCGAYVLKLPERSTQAEAAEGLIGTIDEATGKGRSGLELAFDNELQGKKTPIALIADSSGKLLKGYGPVIYQGKEDVEAWGFFGQESGRKGNGEDITTTIDLALQKKCEAALEAQNLDEQEAVCIVTDTDTGEILAIAQNGDGKTENPALERELSVGEIGDFIVYACALEKGKISDDTTSSLAAEIGYDAILEKCYKLGFGQKCLNYFPREAKGYLPYAEEITSQNIGSITSAGSPILVTPVQMAKAVTILARGGRKVELKLLDADRTSDIDEAGGGYVFEKGLTEKAAKAFQGLKEDGEDRLLKAMGIERTFSWQSENPKDQEDSRNAGNSKDAVEEKNTGDSKNTGEAVINYWVAGDLQNIADEDDGTERNRKESSFTAGSRTVIVLVRGGTECEDKAEKIFLKVCS